MKSDLNLTSTVDRLGILKSQISALQDEEAGLKKILIEAGVPAIDGDLFRATVSRTEAPEIVDWRAVAERLNPSRQLITAYTSLGSPRTTVRVSARKT